MTLHTMTVEIDALLAREAERRFQKLPRQDRISTKELAGQTGLAYGYVANIIARKRRELEGKVDVSLKQSRRFSRADIEIDQFAAELMGK